MFLKKAISNGEIVVANYLISADIPEKQAQVKIISAAPVNELGIIKDFII